MLGRGEGCFASGAPAYPLGMARAKSDEQKKPKKQGRLSQMWAVFQMTRKADPASVWWMLLALLGTWAVALGLGLALGHPVYVLIMGVPLGLLLALVILARKAERAAYAQIAGQPGASLAAISSLKRGWSVEQEPAAADARTQDMVFRAVGRPGVVLVTEGPLPRVLRLAEQERKRIGRIMPTVPVQLVHAGDGEGQVPLRRLATKLSRMKPAISKAEVIEVSKRLKAIGGVRLPIPKGVDPLRMRPDRKAARGR